MTVSGDIERTLKQFPEVANVVTNLGRPQEATETMALNQGDVYVTFKPKSAGRARSVQTLIPQMDSALAQIPGLDYDFSAPMAMRLDEVVSGVKTELGIKIYGDSLPLLQQTAEQIKGVVAGVRGAEDVSIGVSAGAMQLEVALDRPTIARYGLNVADVREAVETGIGGMAATEVIDGRRRIPVVVRLEDAYRRTPEAVASTLVNTPGGGMVALSQIARVNTVEGPEVVNHENGLRYVVVQSNVRGRDLGGFVADVRRAVGRDVSLPPGYYVTYGGQFENQARATKRLALIVPLVLLVITGLLYASFGTIRHTLIVITAVPLALVGGIAALWARGIHLNLSASVGFIAVAGVAVLNALVMVAYINQLREAGYSLEDAVKEGAAVRLRPVLMTALVASVGFIPMAVSTSSGAEVQRPLATVVIGGLVSATLLTLLVLPTIYLWVERRRVGPASALLHSPFGASSGADLMAETDRAALVRRGQWLSWVSLGYNSLEGMAAVVIGAMAGSVSLVGFGIDSVIEVTSSLASLWLLRSDRHVERRERTEQTALRVVALCFLGLAMYIAIDATRTLWMHEAPGRTLIGIVIAALSVVTMPILARQKRAVAIALGSRALEADATQTDLCMYLSAILLVGLLLNALLGWWWADPVAALIMVPIIAKEGIEGLRRAAPS